MRLLHTSDLHLGRQFNGLSLEEDHATILDQIVTAVVQHDVDVLLLAGDLFDRAAPPASAVRQFNGFLARVAAETRAAVVMIAGNHDSGDRIEAMAAFADSRRALVRGAVSAEEPPLILHDAHGPVVFSGVPFVYEYAARECFPDANVQTPQDVLAAQMAAARAQVPAGARWVVVAHAFVAGAQGSDSERPLVRAGGVETVSPTVFAGADYVALGHLHRPQTAGAAHIRYSGAPLAFGFDEAGAEKSMCLVTLDAAGGATCDLLPFRPRRSVRVLTGLHADLVCQPPSEDFIRVVLTDETPVIDAMKRLRAVFPNACELTYARDSRAGVLRPGAARAAALSDPAQVVADFLRLLRDTPPSEEERRLIADGLQALRQEGGEA
ncbi:exonuclease SbcCD subunit D [Novispirillum itersonii]|uniref:exonuclease SbcCD subunit D n=1 Tax=Novispirillum itersonii TaxID=189 RepID=UPI00036C3CE3|nr:exonuclease SbcCD subunit D [Novispirillum itersonii]